ncbi:hypothetical protein GCM10023200_15730 [Actinomycetospora chlora]|uniref:Uncharacterized protein n=1 Tax=Actinomycetospora chlora TaxID=663608 RepID=A0ABP9ALG5_9PSEU
MTIGPRVRARTTRVAVGTGGHRTGRAGEGPREEDVMDTQQDTDQHRQVEDHAGVHIGHADAQGWIVDFAGVRVGRVLDDGTAEDFAGVHIGRVTGAPRHAAAV